MRKYDGLDKPLMSLNDLLRFNDSKFSSWQDRAEYEGLNPQKTISDNNNKTLKWLQQSGIAFERSRIDRFKRDTMKPDLLILHPEQKELIDFVLKNYSIGAISKKDFERQVLNKETQETVKMTPPIVTEHLSFVENVISPFVVNAIKDYVDLNEDLVDLNFNQTLAAMKAGKKIISQGVLKVDDFMGIPDLMVKIDGKPSKFGNYSYEVRDIKRSHSPKSKFVLQICAYSDLLKTIQGTLPDSGEILLGNGESERFHIQDFYNYYSTLKKNFFNFQEDFDQFMPCEANVSDLLTEWKEEAKKSLQLKIELITNIRPDEIVLMREHGIKYISDLKVVASIPGIPEPTFHRLTKQAFLTKPFEILKQFKNEPGNLYDLPDFKDNDVYLDIKASESLGKEKILFYYNIYHLGEDGNFVHKTFECSSTDKEEGRFQQAMFYVSSIIEKYASEEKIGSIYHFTPKIYEALIEVASKYNKFYQKVQFWLRKKSFVCLQDFIINSVVIKTDEYSLAKIAEVLKFDLQSLGLGFESPLVSLKNHKKSSFDHQINEDVDDALNSLALDKMKFFKRMHEWLIELRTNAKIDFVAYEERPDYKEVEIVETLEYEKKPKEKEREVKALKEKIAKAEDDETKNDLIEELEVLEAENPEEIIAKIKALKENYSFESKEYNQVDQNKKLMVLNLQFQEFHHRESQLKKIETNQLLAAGTSEFMKSLRTLNDLKLTKLKKILDVPPKQQHVLAYYSYKISEDTKISYGDTVAIKNNPTISGARVESMEDGELVLRLGKAYLNVPEKMINRISIIENNADLSHHLTKVILREHSKLDEKHPTLGLNKCFYDFLNRDYPDLIGLTKGSYLYEQTDNLVDITKQHILNLNRSCLVIQGPPGVGKSYTASYAIKALLEQGYKVGISSNSHKAIDGLLYSVAQTCKDLGVNFYKHGKKDKDLPEKLQEVGVKNVNCSEFKDGIEEDAYVIAGTVYAMHKYDYDYLFIDEAGQVALANLFILSAKTKNLVLIGDQNQLEQPVQGIHPGESGESCLEYFLKDPEKPSEAIKVIPRNKGIFLPVTRRMNKELCSVVSKYFYNNELKSIEEIDKPISTQLDLSHCEIVKKSKGFQFINVFHEKNPQYSLEEVDMVKQVVNDLIGQQITKDGEVRQIDKDDIIIVSPYNLQVSKLKKELPDFNIGSVDLFQGQEAPIVIYSLGASEAASRGLEFLLNPNRTNVALSRGKCLAIMIGSKAILNSKSDKMEELKLLNMFSELVLLK